MREGLDEFLAMLGHELRNPLAPIRNAVELIRRDSERSLRLDKVVNIVDRQVTHLTRLVDDLLDASRISRGKMELSRSNVELNRLLEDVVESFRALDNADHRLRVYPADAPVYLNADAVRLTQVFINLLGNAAKFTPNSGDIGLKVEVMQDYVEITIDDTGQGISSADLVRIFDMFYQGSAVVGRDKAGLGLGLTLVRKLVEMHGGTVAAHSAGLDHGSRFVVHLPLATSVAESGTRQTTQSASTTRLRKVLVVDDNRDGVESLAMLLRLDGMDVEVAFDGDAAVREAARYQPHVILLDIGLPKIDGYTAARAIRSDVSSRDVLLVAMTGWGRAEDKRRALEAGFDAHLVKPVSMDALQNIFALMRQPDEYVTLRAKIE